jgi:DDE superfamily endonuclease
MRICILNRMAHGIYVDARTVRFEATRQNSAEFRTPPFYTLSRQRSISPPLQAQIVYKMARVRKTSRRNCQNPDPTVNLSPKSPRAPKTIILLADAQSTVGKMTRKELFKLHNISQAAGYQILKSKIARRSERIYNRGRKKVLASFECEAIEAVENANFRFGTASHLANARAISLANGSERAIQRNIAEYGVKTYVAKQKKYISKSSIEKRVIWGFERRRWLSKHFYGYRFSDECHFACGLQRRARIHRRPGEKARNLPQKIQFRLKRRNQIFHVFAYIGYDFKSELYFYTGAGGSGRLTQADYVVILEGVVAPNWDANWIPLEDNDNSHGTLGVKDNKCKQAKRRLGIKCESNPPQSPDLNPIETIWRTIKQRLKNRGLILDGTQLRRAIQEEWDNITLEEINRAIDSMPKRVA